MFYFCPIFSQKIPIFVLFFHKMSYFCPIFHKKCPRILFFYVSYYLTACMHHTFHMKHAACLVVITMQNNLLSIIPVADPGFPMGGTNLGGGGHQLLRWLHFEKFVCQNKRIWTLGGMHWQCPLDLPMHTI